MENKYITLTWSFIKDKSTTMQEKLILMEINNLSMLKMGCVAHNEHFASLMGIKKETVSRLINSLVEKGFITSTIKDGSRNFSRTITINKMLLQDEKAITNCLESKENKTSSLSNQLDYDDFFNLWNEFATKNNKAKIAKLSDSRKKKIALRLKEYKNLLEIFTYVLKKSESSNFLLNGNFYTFDWLFENDTNILKVYEGKYDNGKSQEVVM